MLAEKAKKAVKLIDDGLLHLKPVKIRQNARVEIRPGEEVELRGSVTGTTPTAEVTVMPRPSELLPHSLHIKSANIRKTGTDSPEVGVIVQNLDCHRSVTL